MNTFVKPFNQFHVNQLQDSQFTKRMKIKPNNRGKNQVNLICWNKGNSLFDSKKDELELLINKYSPLLLGVLEANIGQDQYLPMISIDGYNE